MQVSGSVVTALKVSLTRSQYEQLLDTFQWLTATPTVSNIHTGSRTASVRIGSVLSDISEEDTGVTTLKMDPHVRAKLFPAVSLPKAKPSSKRNIALKGNFYVQFISQSF